MVEGPGQRQVVPVGCSVYSVGEACLNVICRCRDKIPLFGYHRHQLRRLIALVIIPLRLSVLFHGVTNLVEVWSPPVR